MQNTVSYSYSAAGLIYECLDSVNNERNSIILSINALTSGTAEIYLNSKLFDRYDIYESEEIKLTVSEDLFNENNLIEFKLSDFSVSFTFPEYIGRNMRLEHETDYDFSVKYTASQNDNIFLTSWPVGSVFPTFDRTNPGELYGGVWELSCKGRAIIGVDPGDSDFSEAGKTGGEKTHKLTSKEIPSHKHEFRLKYTQDAASGNAKNRVVPGGGSGEEVPASQNNYYTKNTGNGEAHNNMPPYITLYLWRRVA